MTNLSAILQTYFIDVSVDKIINSIGKHNPSLEQGMDECAFKKHFLKHNTMYGTDIVSCIHDYANSYWLSYDGNADKSVFNILRRSTENILHWDDSGENPVCKYDDFLKWNDISSRLGEDIFTTSFFANKSVQENISINSFAWKPHLISDSKEVNEIINRDLTEQHFHMYGSSLCFDVNWIAAMNDCGCINGNRAKLDSFKRNLTTSIIKASAIRLFLYNFLFNAYLNIKESDLVSLLNAKNHLEVCTLFHNFKTSISIAKKHNTLNYGKFIYDYALTNDISANDYKRYYNIPLIGERKFLYAAFTKIYYNDKSFKSYRSYFYAYLVAKNNVRQFFIQDNQTKGFSRFHQYDRRKSLLIDNTPYWDIFCFISAQNTICNQTVHKLEMRITPKNSSKDLANDIKSTNANINDKIFRLKQNNLITDDQNNNKIGYIIHFIKEKDNVKNKSTQCRNEELRNKLDNQAIAIYTLVRRNSMYAQGGIIPQRKLKEKSTTYPIIGIDAASSEFGCRPEVFAPTFRFLKEVPHNNKTDFMYYRKNFQLGRTFHVGEDFYDIVDGLRAIDECVYFLNFGEGDRLGHCVALGIEPRKYYKTRNYSIILPKQILLDNAVWLFFQMEKHSIPDENGLKYRLKNIFHLYYPELYKGVNGSIDEYFYAWKLRGDEPRRTHKGHSQVEQYSINRINPELDTLRENDKVKRIYQAYHDHQVIENGNKLVEYELHDSDVWVIQELQQYMRKEISRKKISIETNPTSNIIITDVERYSKHPILQFYNYGLADDANPEQINVSINTDDQGVFATSLEKEFTLMACALEKKRNDSDGKPTYSPKDIYKWLDDIRQSASRSTFFKD